MPLTAATNAPIYWPKNNGRSFQLTIPRSQLPQQLLTNSGNSMDGSPLQLFVIVGPPMKSVDLPAHILCNRNKRKTLDQPAVDNMWPKNEKLFHQEDYMKKYFRKESQNFKTYTATPSAKLSAVN